MILIDSSVWIDYFNGADTEATGLMHSMIGKEKLIVGDLIMAEVLQGFRRDKDFETAKELMTAFDTHQISTPQIAIRGAAYFRKLRKKGITVRKTVDVLIATYCIENAIALLQADKDFLPFSNEFGLKLLP